MGQSADILIAVQNDTLSYCSTPKSGAIYSSNTTTLRRRMRRRSQHRWNSEKGMDDQLLRAITATLQQAELAGRKHRRLFWTEGFRETWPISMMYRKKALCTTMEESLGVAVLHQYIGRKLGWLCSSLILTAYLASPAHRTTSKPQNKFQLQLLQALTLPQPSK